MLASDADRLEQLAGVTGLGWTGSVLSYLVLMIGYGNGYVSRLIVDPQSLLYLGGVLFVTTLGLDRLRDRVSGRGGLSQMGIGSPTLV